MRKSSPNPRRLRIANCGLRNKIRSLVLLAGIVFPLFTAGCALHPYQAAPVVENPELQRRYLEVLQKRYPAQFRLKQRLALRALGKQYDMIGYLAIQPGGDFRAYGMGEMGGRIFDLALEKGAPKIYKKPDTMPPNPLLDGVIGDIRHLFEIPAFTSASLHLSDRRGSFLALRQGVSRLSDYHFEGDGPGVQPELRSSLESDGRRILRETGFSNYRILPGYDRPVPTHIVIKNYRWHYEMEIEALEIIPGGSSQIATEAR